MSQPPSLTLATVRLPDENWLPPSLARLSPSILTQSEAFTPQRRCQFLTGRWLLAELMHRQFGCDQLPEMGEPVNGRPSFASASLPDFNLSHSGTDLIVALAQGCRVGVDIEQNRPRKSCWRWHSTALAKKSAFGLLLYRKAAKRTDFGNCGPFVSRCLSFLPKASGR